MSHRHSDAVPPVPRLAVKAKNLLCFDGLLDPSHNGTYVNTAVLTARIYGADKTTLLASFPMTLSYVTGTKGDYEGWTAKLDTITAQSMYYLELVDAQGYVYRFIRCIAYARSVA